MYVSFHTRILPLVRRHRHQHRIHYYGLLLKSCRSPSAPSSSISFVVVVPARTIITHAPSLSSSILTMIPRPRRGARMDISFSSPNPSPLQPPSSSTSNSSPVSQKKNGNGERPHPGAITAYYSCFFFVNKYTRHTPALRTLLCNYPTRDRLPFTPETIERIGIIKYQATC